MWYLILLQSPRIYVVHLSRFKTIEMYFFYLKTILPSPTVQHYSSLHSLASFGWWLAQILWPDK